MAQDECDATHIIYTLVAPEIIIEHSRDIRDTEEIHAGRQVINSAWLGICKKLAYAFRDDEREILEAMEVNELRRWMNLWRRSQEDQREQNEEAGKNTHSPSDHSNSPWKVAIALITFVIVMIAWVYLLFQRNGH